MGRGSQRSQPRNYFFEQDYDLANDWQDRSYPIVQHIFSHRKWQVQIRYGLVKEGEQPASESTVWLTPEEFSTILLLNPSRRSGRLFRKMKK